MLDIHPRVAVQPWWMRPLASRLQMVFPASCSAPEGHAVKRRTFCSAVLGGGLAAGLCSLARPLPLSAAAPENAAAAHPDLVAVQGSSTATALDKGIEALGGMQRFVRPGQTVLIKPNMGWAVAPEGGANTNPLLVKRLAEICAQAGAKKITCFDNPCDHWRNAYSDSGIERAARDAGVIVAPPHSESYYQSVQIAGGRILRQAKVHELYMEADVIINVPVLKHHGGAGLSSAMKNLMGVVWDRHFYHARGLDQCIADFTAFARRPALNVVDAGRVMLTGGPRGRADSRFKVLDMLILSPDIVAADTASALSFGARPENFAYIAMAAALGVGKASLDGLDVRRVRV